MPHTELRMPHLGLTFLLKHYKVIINIEPDGAGGGTVLVGAASGALALGIGCQAAQSPGENKYEK